MRFTRSAAEFLRRHNIIDSMLPLPGPRLSAKDLLVHRVPVYPSPAYPPWLLVAEGDPPPDRVVVVDLRN